MDFLKPQCTSSHQGDTVVGNEEEGEKGDQGDQDIQSPFLPGLGGGWTAVWHNGRLSTLLSGLLSL